MTIGQLIKQSRKEKGITQNELAKRIGVSAGAISRWESGDIENMRRDRIEKLADALGIDPNIIIGIEPNKEMDGNIPILEFPANPKDFRLRSLARNGFRRAKIAH